MPNRPDPYNAEDIASYNRRISRIFQNCFSAKEVRIEQGTRHGWDREVYMVLNKPFEIEGVLERMTILLRQYGLRDIHEIRLTETELSFILENDNYHVNPV